MHDLTLDQAFPFVFATQSESLMQEGAMKMARGLRLKWVLLTFVSVLLVSQLAHYSQVTERAQDDEEEVTEAGPPPINGEDTQPFLFVVFTTFVEDPARRPMHLAAIRNWALLGPYVKPILFTQTPNSSLNTIAHENGWDIMAVPRTNQYGTPFIRDMYFVAYKSYKSMYYGYTNGDILFSYSVLYTLMAVHSYFDLQKDKLDANTTFVVGTRSDYALTEASPSWLHHPEHVEQLTVKQPLYIGGVDYFITTRYGFPWSDMLDLVIGRAGIDNYLLGEAVRRKMNMVDVTETMPVLHLQGRNGTLTHLSLNHPDANFNRLRFGYKSYDYTQCQTANALFETYKRGNFIGLRPRTAATTLKLMPPQLVQLYLRRHAHRATTLNHQSNVSNFQRPLLHSTAKTRHDSEVADQISRTPMRSLIKNSTDQPEIPSVKRPLQVQMDQPASQAVNNQPVRPSTKYHLEEQGDQPLRPPLDLTHHTKGHQPWTLLQQTLGDVNKQSPVSMLPRNPADQMAATNPVNQESYILQKVSQPETLSRLVDQVAQSSNTYVDQPAKTYQDQPAKTYINTAQSILVDQVAQSSITHVDQPAKTYQDQPAKIYTETAASKHVLPTTHEVPGPYAPHRKKLVRVAIRRNNEVLYRMREMKPK